MTEQHAHEVFLSLEGGQAVLPHLVDHAPTPRVQELLRRLQQYISWGAVYDVFDLILDESDLLVAYPEDAQRQFAEAWLTIVQGIGKDTGHDASEMYRRMVAVRNLGNQGPQAITQPTSSAVQIMTIHGSKGLQAPVVVVTVCFLQEKPMPACRFRTTFWSRRRSWPTHSTLKAKERPQDGLWAFTAEMNKAQDKAELRRKFYVALTRVKDRLILTGAVNKASFDETTGLLSVRFAPDPRTMGRMLVEGLRRASWNAQTPAPWLSADEVEKDMLPLFSSNATETPFNPTSLLDGSPLGINGLAGLRVYHHPSCFETMTTHSPQQRVRALATHLERLGEASVEDATPLLLEENIKAGPPIIWTPRHPVPESIGWNTSRDGQPNRSCCRTRPPNCPHFALGQSLQPSG